MSGEVKQVLPIQDICVDVSVYPTSNEFSWCKPQIAEASWLGYKRGSGKAMTDFKITHGETDITAEGFNKLAHNINPRGKEPVYLWWRRQEGGVPLFGVKVVSSHDHFSPAGYVKQPLPINPGLYNTRTPRQYLATLNQADFEKQQKREWSVGDKIDCTDTQNKWMVARIQAIDTSKQECHVNYVGWPHKWDEWISLTSDRLGPLAWKTSGWTGQDPRPPFNMEEHEETLKTVYAKLLEVEKAINEGKDRGEGKEITEEELAFLVKGQNREFLVYVLQSSVDEGSELMQLLVDFLTANLRVIIKCLSFKTVHPRILGGLVGIFAGGNMDKRFFDNHGVLGKEKLIHPETFAKRVIEKGQPINSSWFYEFINFFGANKGFDLIGARLIAATESKSPYNDGFENIHLMVRSLATIRYILIPAFAKKYFKGLKLKELISTAIAKMTDEEMKVIEKDVVATLQLDIKAMLELAGSKEKELEEISERTSLDYSLRLLSTDVLRKRIDALTNIQEQIRAVQYASNSALAKKEIERREEENRSQYPTSSAWQMGNRSAAKEIVLPKAKFLTPDYMCKWIQDCKLVETILNKQSHEQLIKLSPLILKFLAQNHALKEEHINLLWTLGVTGHDALKRIMYECLAELAEDLNEKQLTALYYDRIVTLPLREYRDFNLTFLKNFTINSVKATGGSNNKWFGLDRLWEMNLDDNAKDLDKDVVALARQYLPELLQIKAFHSQRGAYLEKCIKSIKENKSVLPCLNLAKDIIASYEGDAEKLINQLEKSNKLMDTVLENARNYTEAAKKAASAQKTDVKQEVKSIVAPVPLEEGEEAAAPAEVVDERVLVGIHPHHQQLAVRLSFLEFLLSNSKLTLENSHINSLVDIFVTNAFFW